MKVGEFMKKYACGIAYAKDRYLIDASKDCEVVGYVVAGLPNQLRYRIWAFVFRSRSKQLMAVVNGRREYAKNVVDLIKNAQVVRETPDDSIVKELMIQNI